MSGLTLLAPLGLLGLVAVPVVILLYMRTTTPTERRIPTTRFWAGAETAPTDHQRFRLPPLSLLLLAHILIVSLIALALAQPASATLLNRFAGRSDPHHLILIIDGSTSMDASVDPLGRAGRTHFTLARQSAAAHLRDLSEGDSATVVLIGTHTSTYQASDLAEVDALADLIGGHPLPGGQADLNAALRLCRDLVVPGVRDEIILITDGAGSVDPTLVAELTAPITLERTESSISTSNIAITELTATGSASFPGRQDVFVRVVNFGDRRVVVPITIGADGIDVIQRELTIDPGATATVTQLLPEGAQIASAAIPVEDALYADNSAQVSLAESGLSGIRVLLVSDEPSAILKALSAIPGSQVDTRTSNQFLASGTPQGIDLIVFEGPVPATTLPAIPVLSVNPGANGPSMSLPAPVRIRTMDPILTGVELAGVSFGEVPIQTLGAQDVEIVGAEGGPLIYRTRSAADQPAVVLAFDVAQTNLPVRVAFPILIANIVDDLVDQGLPASLSSGDPLKLSVGPETDEVVVTMPDGTVRTLPVVRADDASTTTMTFGETGQPGMYQIELRDAAGNALSHLSVIVNAGHPQESNLTPNPLVESALQTPTSAAEAGTSRLRFDLWPILLMMVLGLLLLEWLISLLTHNRRTLLHAPGSGPG